VRLAQISRWDGSSAASVGTLTEMEEVEHGVHFKSVGLGWAGLPGGQFIVFSPIGSLVYSITREMRVIFFVYSVE
jgi:hypothetical protein